MSPQARESGAPSAIVMTCVQPSPSAVRFVRRSFPVGSQPWTRAPDCRLSAWSGAGQLARMTHQAAIALGHSLRVLADSADDGAAMVAANVIVGDYRSLADLRTFADRVRRDHLRSRARARRAHHGARRRRGRRPSGRRPRCASRRTRSRCARGWPSSASPVRSGPAWTTPRDLGAFGAARRLAAGHQGGVAAATTARACGWSTRSTRPCRSSTSCTPAAPSCSPSSAWPFDASWPPSSPARRSGRARPGRSSRRSSATASASRSSRRRPTSTTRPPTTPNSWPCASRPNSASSASSRSSSSRTSRGRLLVNELAMRPHNSGHWTIEGARTSQFEQHLRAVLDYPLGTTEPTAPVVVMANLLGGADDVTPKGIDERVHHCMARWPDVKIHLYGKGISARPQGRSRHRARHRPRDGPRHGPGPRPTT